TVLTHPARPVRLRSRSWLPVALRPRAGPLRPVVAHSPPGTCRQQGRLVGRALCQPAAAATLYAPVAPGWWRYRRYRLRTSPRARLPTAPARAEGSWRLSRAHVALVDFAPAC